MKTIIEPFRIKVTEPLKVISKEERIAALKNAHNNVFLLHSEDCAIDLLTDSGTGAMSTKQWAAMMLGDESYAGSPSFRRFEETVRLITGMKHIFPTHQGRAAEGILALTKIKPGDIVPNNSHFDTTRANFEFAGAYAMDLICEEGLENDFVAPFKGNMDLRKLEDTITGNGAEKIPFAMMTVTNNTSGGQPVSMENIRKTKALLDKYGIPFVMDVCRFAENAFFIQQREKGYENKTLLEIAQEMFSYADAATMSLKKDGLVNIGGFLVCNDDDWAEDFKNALIMREGFITYGGLAGRDLEAAAVGLMEALETDYQKYRHATIEYLAKALDSKNIPYVKPVGGHAVFIDAKAFLPHIPPLEYPGIALVNTLYLAGGIRSVELGSVMFGRFDDNGNEQPGPLELVRLAIPRRVYTQSHFDYIAETLDYLMQDVEKVKGYKITYQPKYLRHFTCHFEQL
ncbi:MAG: tryptophanase [Calditrichae bacterium]|nr:tryptophanase [Calditrichia bacterium]